MRASVPRVVFDTNVVLSTLLFGGSRATRLRQAWRSSAIVPLVSRTTAAELVRVLSYPKFKLSAADQHELLGEYLPMAEVVLVPESLQSLPVCRDPFDLPFLQLASVAGADALVSGDADLLVLRDQVSFPILTMAEFFDSFLSATA